MKRIEIDGEKPYQYSNEKFKEFNREAYANEYQLVTGDSFEFGGGYSLHLTKEDAIGCYIDICWKATSRGNAVFVTSKTIEDISTS